jgi:IS5 family transposase
MSIKKTEQRGFCMKQLSFYALAHQKKLRCERFLEEMDHIVPWDLMMDMIQPYYEEQEIGRKRKDMKMMLKIYCLQQWYELSDPGAEEAIYDRNSFQRFLGIDLMQDAVPDETTILHFRHLLEKHGIQENIFAAVRDLLEKKRLIMKRGTIVDATILEAASSTKNQEKRRDPDMSSTKKGNEWHFGMKAHIGVDAESGLVHSLETTTARIHDKEVEELLYHGEEKARFGDKGYYDEKKKRALRQEGIYWGIADRGKRNHALSSSQKRKNRKISSIRSKVEFPFHVVKCLWGYTKVRYKGLYKNTCQLFMLFALANLYRIRKKRAELVPQTA